MAKMGDCNCMDRRDFLKLGGMTLVISAIDPGLVRAIGDPRLERLRTTAGSGKTFIFIFQRFGADGLNTVIPIEAGEYATYSGYRSKSLAIPMGNLTPQQRDTVGPFVRAADAYAAVGYLRTLDFIDGKRIGVMGGSHGGTTTLVAMVEPAGPGAPLVREKRNGFAAGIALYPDCGNRYGAWVPSRRSGNVGPVSGYSGVYRPIAPLLILSGEKDDWTPAAPCQALADRAREAGYPVSLKVYPGAHHSFDSNAPVHYNPLRNNINKAEGKGATTGGDSGAWADAVKQVKAFFGEHLAQH